MSLLYAQSPSYLRYTTEDGLPTNYVYGVVEDANGAIWAYTENGLAKFDGYNFQVLNTTDGLPGNDITWALRAPDGKIWLYAYGNRPAYLLNDSIHVIGAHPAVLNGLLSNGQPVYNGADNLESLSSFTYDTTLVNLNCLYVSPEEFQRFGANWKEIQSFPNTVSNIKKTTAPYTKKGDCVTTWKFPELTFFSKYFLQPERYVYLSKNGLHWQEHGRWKNMPFPNNFVSGGLSVSPLPDHPGRFFVSSKETGTSFLFDIDQEEVRRFSVKQYGLRPKYYTNISIQDTSLWLLSDAGSVELNYAGELLRQLNWSPKESAWFPLRPYTDRAGNVWQGTRNGGLLMIPLASQAIRMRTLPASGNQYLKRLLRMPDDRILGIAENGQVYEIGADDIELVFKPEKEQLFRSESIVEDQLLLVLEREIFLLAFDQGKIKATDFHDIYPSFLNYGRLGFANANTTTYSSLNKRLYTSRSYTTGFRWELSPSAKSHDPVTALDTRLSVVYVHPVSGDVYGGEINGLFKLKSEVFLPVMPGAEELRNIYSLFGTPGKLWIGTESNGLFRYDTGTNKLERVIKEGFIRAIRADNDCGILAATAADIFVVPLDDSRNFQTYGITNGLPNYEIKDILALGDSALLVASSGGLYELQRNDFRLPPLDSNAFQLTDIYANEKQVQETDLPYTTNQLDFRFSLRSYASNGNIIYRTRLDPLETGWQESRERFRRYTGLRPGEYVFQAEAVDVYGRTVSLSPLGIKIRHAFWQQVWFQALIAVGAMAVIFLLVKRRLDEAKRKLADEQALNQRLAGMELEALKAQMNPHFIFNALGSIQYFIQTQEVDLADDYLTRFASLMRQYLDSSRETLLPIEKEVALLRNYTELEQMRFEELFRVELHVSDDMMVSGFLVPTMMIQPFVENAINHGLSERRDGKGLLSIHFTQSTSDTIRCTIRDNGIGRKRSARHKRPGHQSRGMKIVEEKIDTLTAANLLVVSYTITDADPGDAHFPGTLVTLNFKSPDYANP